MRSISRRIFVSLAITTVTSLFAYACRPAGALDRAALRERALLEQANPLRII